LISLQSEDEFLSKIQQVPLQRLCWGLAQQKGIEVWIRRDDLIDSHVSGNKFYKLFYNLQAAQQLGANQLLTFGGAWSNHIYALAAAAKQSGFKAVGVIRGERPAQLSATLADAEAWGMKLHFVSRAEYQQKTAHELHEHLRELYGDFFAIPEGGANSYGLKGTRALGQAIGQQAKAGYTSVCLASGTANTLTGIAMGLAENLGGVATATVPNVIGFSVLKGDVGLGGKVVAEQQVLRQQTANWRLISGYHGGGYANKLPQYLTHFMREFEAEIQLRLDPVYTLKMCWGVAQLLAQNYWPTGSKLILIHTGGLQGRRGFDLP